MKRDSKMEANAPGTDSTWEFPLLKLYFVSIVLLVILSVVVFSVQADPSSSPPWTISVELRVTSITLVLLLLGWLPLLLPWLSRISPRLQEFFTGLRQGGLEEIEAGILRIKLSAGVEKTAALYEANVAEVSREDTRSREIAKEIEDLYRDTLEAADTTDRISSQEALDRINQLSGYYNRLRAEMSSSPERTQLSSNIAATMFSLMPSIGNNFSVRERIHHPLAGQRLAAYTYLEYKPSPEFLELLLSRAVGVLEVPFSQFHALLALRRMVSLLNLTEEEKLQISELMNWAVSVPYIGRDRQSLMNHIIRIITFESSSM